MLAKFTPLQHSPRNLQLLPQAFALGSSSAPILAVDNASSRNFVPLVGTPPRFLLGGGPAMQGVQQIKEHVADAENGHSLPFFINKEIIHEKKFSRLPAGWAEVGWYHVAKCTIDRMAQVLPFIQSYQQLATQLGYATKTKSVQIHESEDAIWARLAPPAHRLRRVGGQIGRAHV